MGKERDGYIYIYTYISNYMGMSEHLYPSKWQSFSGNMMIICICTPLHNPCIIVTSTSIAAQDKRRDLGR